MRDLGIYIHIPFCRAKCRYCDFCSHPPRRGELDDYVAALCRQIVSWRPRVAQYTADTVYFGGGTPSLLSPRQLADILDALSSALTISPDAEITLECNPATVTAAVLRELRRVGVNRLSIGAQSLNDAELAALGRLHDAAAVGETVNAARAAGFDNLSLDLMYGIPHQTRESFAATVCGVLDMAPEHVSAYGLRVEEGTPFGRMGARLVLPDEDECADMYLDVCDALEAAGIGQYEISNFARAGRESRHNLKYWHCDDYLGVGVAASSFFEGERFTAACDTERYIRSALGGGQCAPDSAGDGERCIPDSAGGSVFFGAELRERTMLTATEREVEYVMLALRLREGVRYDDYTARFGSSAEQKYLPRLAGYIARGLVSADISGFSLTRSGMLVSNSILADILDL